MCVNACSSLCVSPKLVTCPGCTPPLAPGEPVILHDPVKGGGRRMDERMVYSLNLLNRSSTDDFFFFLN